MTPTKWWHFLLVYPTALIAVLGVAERVYDKYSDAPTAYEQKQAELASVNLECLRLLGDAIPLITKDNTEVYVVPCPSGDVLLTGRRAGELEAKMKWVRLKDLMAPSTEISEFLKGLSPIQEAVALEPQTHSQMPQVICQRWVDTGILLQRVFWNGGCFDNIINTYKGVVIQSTPAPCDTAC